MYFQISATNVVDAATMHADSYRGAGEQRQMLDIEVGIASKIPITNCAVAATATSNGLTPFSDGPLVGGRLEDGADVRRSNGGRK